MAEGGERRWIDPLQVVHRDDEALRRRDPREQGREAAPEEPAFGLAGHRGQLDPESERGQDQRSRVGLDIGLRLVDEVQRVVCRGGAPDPDDAAQQVADRSVGAVLVVRGAPDPRDARATEARVRDELLDEPRLSKTALAHDRDQPAPSGQRVIERAEERAHLRIPPHERGALRWRAVFERRADEPPGDDRRRLAARDDRWMGLVGEESRRAPVRRVTDEHLARLSGLLQPRRHVDRIAQHTELALPVADGAGHGDAGVHADAERQAALGPLPEPLVGALERGQDRERRALGLLRV